MIPAGPYAFDLTVTHALQASQPTWLNGIAKIITFVGLPELALGISLVIIIWWFLAPWLVKLAGHGAGAWRRQEQAVWLLLLMLGNALTLIIKHLVERPRPDLVQVLVRETSTSFPSGHALGAVITAAALWYFRRYHFDQKGWWTAGLVFFILAVGWSRVYLGVHWASDVLAGYFFGGLWLVVVWSGLAWSRRRRADSLTASKKN